MDKFIYNRKALEDNRRQLRKQPTPAEELLWGYLRNKQLADRKFRRQFSVGNCILDFYCTSERLCVELDGQQHYTEEGLTYDQERTQYLNSLDIRVIRFKNQLVLTSVQKVLAEIKIHFRD